MAFQPELFSFELGEHHGKDVIWIHFPNDSLKKSHLRQYVVAHWSQTQKCWYARDVAAYRTLFLLPPKSIGKNAIPKIDPVNQEVFLHYHDHLVLKAYSPSTIRTYCLEFAQFLYIIKSHPAQDISHQQLRSYFLYCTQKLRLSENQLHSRINALKFYYEQVLHQEKFFCEIPRPKKNLLLPHTLNKKEIGRLFMVTDNIKHRLLLELCYGMGLRVSEIVRLKISDIDSVNMQVRIERAKGKKDRLVNLPKSILEELRVYYKKYLPKKFLFEGQYGEEGYSVRSAQAVFKQAMKKANINKPIGIHGLRHSYATHLLEMGTDVSLIQKLLGHNNIKTTLIYTQVSQATLQQVKSPLDDMGGE